MECCGVWSERQGQQVASSGGCGSRHTGGQTGGQTDKDWWADGRSDCCRGRVGGTTEREREKWSDHAPREACARGRCGRACRRARSWNGRASQRDSHWCLLTRSTERDRDPCCGLRGVGSDTHHFGSGQTQMGLAVPTAWRGSRWVRERGIRGME